MRELSKTSEVEIRALVRNLEDPRVADLATLPRVTLIAGDFDEVGTIQVALEGVDRAFLVTAPFDHLHFERETDFIELAAEAGVPVVRIGTATMLTSAGTKTAYGRAHHGIESFASAHGFPVVTLRPNWFLDNLLFAADEIKGGGQITYPTTGDGEPVAMVDPRDVAAAAAAILVLPGDQLASFVEERLIEVHGKGLINLSENVKVLAEAVGYPIEINEVPLSAWIDTMVGYGMPRVFARAFGGTIMKVDGKMMADGATTQTSSTLLTSIGWEPKYDAADWANSPKVQAALRKGDPKEEL